jgi:hypothetical protein
MLRSIRWNVFLSTDNSALFACRRGIGKGASVEENVTFVMLGTAPPIVIASINAMWRPT